ncbi:uncharacterized protein JCM15063_001332 [Sporobolomyces koalae]|uniref:uncharacterized protein n=1 Tax=Sporobolomyces koalae TaxID=500713 RepID=UPI00317C296F
MSYFPSPLKLDEPPPIAGPGSSSRDGASPTKKRRVSSSTAARSANPDHELYTNRLNSTLRLRDAWADITRRHTTFSDTLRGRHRPAGRTRAIPVDDDDIIDLKHLTIVTDRGVLRNSKRGSFPIGGRGRAHNGRPDPDDRDYANQNDDDEQNGDDTDEGLSWEEATTDSDDELAELDNLESLPSLSYREHRRLATERTAELEQFRQMELRIGPARPHDEHRTATEDTPTLKVRPNEVLAQPVSAPQSRSEAFRQVSTPLRARTEIPPRDDSNDFDTMDSPAPVERIPLSASSPLSKTPRTHSAQAPATTPKSACSSLRKRVEVLDLASPPVRKRRTPRPKQQSVSPTKYPGTRSATFARGSAPPPSPDRPLGVVDPASSPICRSSSNRGKRAKTSIPCAEDRHDSSRIVLPLSPPNSKSSIAEISHTTSSRTETLEGTSIARIGKLCKLSPRTALPTPTPTPTPPPMSNSSTAVPSIAHQNRNLRNGEEMADSPVTGARPLSRATPTIAPGSRASPKKRTTAPRTSTFELLIPTGGRSIRRPVSPSKAKVGIATTSPDRAIGNNEDAEMRESASVARCGLPTPPVSKNGGTGTTTAPVKIIPEKTRHTKLRPVVTPAPSPSTVASKTSFQTPSKSPDLLSRHIRAKSSPFVLAPPSAASTPVRSRSTLADSSPSHTRTTRREHLRGSIVEQDPDEADDFTLSPIRYLERNCARNNESTQNDSPKSTDIEGQNGLRTENHFELGRSRRSSTRSIEMQSPSKMQRCDSLLVIPDSEGEEEAIETRGQGQTLRRRSPRLNRGDSSAPRQEDSSKRDGEYSEDELMLT